MLMAKKEDTNELRVEQSNAQTFFIVIEATGWKLGSLNVGGGGGLARRAQQRQSSGVPD